MLTVLTECKWLCVYWSFSSSQMSEGKSCVVLPLLILSPIFPIFKGTTSSLMEALWVLTECEIIKCVGAEVPADLLWVQPLSSEVRTAADTLRSERWNQAELPGTTLEAELVVVAVAVLLVWSGGAAGEEVLTGCQQSFWMILITTEKRLLSAALVSCKLFFPLSPPHTSWWTTIC